MYKHWPVEWADDMGDFDFGRNERGIGRLRLAGACYFERSKCCPFYFFGNSYTVFFAYKEFGKIFLNSNPSEAIFTHMGNRPFCVGSISRAWMSLVDLRAAIPVA